MLRHSCPHGIDDLFLVLEWFENVILRAKLESLDGCVYASVSSDNDHGNIGILTANVLQQLNTVHLWQHYICDYDIEFGTLEKLDTLLGVR